MNFAINDAASTRQAGPWLVVTWCGLALLALSGCAGDRTLETGYVYQPLNSTSVEQRAFYADPYSLEAMEAQAEQRSRNRSNPLPGGS